MPGIRSSRFLTFGALVIAFSAVAGGFWGRSALVAQDQIPDQYKVFTAALGAIEENYVGEYDRTGWSTAALRACCKPSIRIRASWILGASRRCANGRRGAITGSASRSMWSRATSPIFTVFEGSPAHQKGLRRGDVIAKIEGEDAKGWTSEQAVSRLRGPKQSSVNISIRRVGYDGLIDLAVMRDEVHIPTVPAAVMLDATTGYIKLQDFGENTDQELGGALEALTKQGMARLMLDLRGNPGGALDQAIRVSNRFLPKGDLIVYTRGRVPNSDQDYRATEQSDYLRLPMITLVNRSSASASEIVSGALQDHDRSLIVGETTFGKALVQSVYRVAEGAGAAITTARYYTPSGRLIQRPWDVGFDEYLTYTWREQDRNRVYKQEDLKLTDAGRKVYSGGGIEPDRRFDGPSDGFNPTRFARTIAARNLFDNYAQQFTRQGDTRVTKRSGPVRELAPDFEVTDEMLNEFKQLVQKSPIPFDEKSWQADLDYIKAMIHREIDIDLFGVAAAYKNFARHDPQMQFALGLFPEAQQLLQMSRQNGGRRAAR